MNHILTRTLTYPEPGHRWFTWDAHAGELCDGYLHITQGVPGPRGGTKHIDRAGYFVQLVQQPEDERIDVVALLLKEEPDADGEDVYEVTVPPDGGPRKCCCTGFRTQDTCKHIDAVGHMVCVLGWGVA